VSSCRSVALSESETTTRTRREQDRRPRDTDRLIIETLTRAHARGLAEVMLDPEVYAHITGEHPESEAALADKYAAMAAGPPPHFVGEQWLSFAL
jgi:hypothetical protein